LLAFTLNQAQTNRDAINGALDVSYKNNKMEYVTRPASVSQDRGGSSICDSLLVQPIQNNGYDGVMFDLHVINFVTLETFSIRLSAGNPWVGIFYRTGTYVGNTNSSAGWILLHSAQVNVPVEAITKIPVNVNLPLLADSNYTFYVTIIDNVTGCKYKDGTTGVGTIAASDANIQIKEGAGGQYPFNVTNSLRVLVGSAYYCQVVTGVEVTDLEKEFTIQPNPATNLLSIAGTSKIDHIEITDLAGRLVHVNNIERTIDCSEFAKGVYFLRITSGQK